MVLSVALPYNRIATNWQSADSGSKTAKLYRPNRRQTLPVCAGGFASENLQFGFVSALAARTACTVAVTEIPQQSAAYSIKVVTFYKNALQASKKLELSDFEPAIL